MIAQNTVFGRLVWAVVTLVATLMLLTVAPASAAPYPPIPPTGGLLTPASAPVPAPAVSVGAIAPGSFPVQARTGSASVPGDPGVSPVVLLIAVAASSGVLVTGGVAVLRSRRRREPTAA